MSEERKTEQEQLAREEHRNIGKLLVIGGAEDPDEDDMKILPRFVEICGGKKARIIVCGSPSSSPAEKEREYARLFRKLGAADVYEAKITTRPDAENEELISAAERATGIFFTGGDQMRLTSLIAGTPFSELILERLWSDGLNVAGTSAGAAAMSSTMFTGGSDDGTVRRADVRLAPGLGLLRDTLIDTHFAQRGRISRILTVFGQNPQVLGIGIDENTAIEVEPGKCFRVLGQGAVFVLDGTVTHSNAPEVSEEDVIALTDVVLHVLPESYSFDLPKTRPVLPDGTKVDEG